MHACLKSEKQQQVGQRPHKPREEEDDRRREGQQLQQQTREGIIMQWICVYYKHR